MVSTRDQWNAMTVEQRTEALADTNKFLLEKIQQIEARIDRIVSKADNAFGNHENRINILEAKD